MKRPKLSLRDHYLMTVATITAVVLHKTNFLLRFLADIFASDTFDRLASRYANWYNLGMIASLLNFEGRLGKKKVSLHVEAQETMDDLMIASLTHRNLEDKDIEAYISSRLSVMAGIDHSSIKLNRVGESESKLIIPIMIS